MTAADSKAEEKKNIFICWLLLTNPSPTSIQGTLCLGPEGASLNISSTAPSLISNFHCPCGHAWLPQIRVK